MNAVTIIDGSAILDPDHIAERIRARVRRTVIDIIETGRDLIQVKDALPHGEFLPWIKCEFGWSDRTARNYMAAAEWVGDIKTETVSVLPPKVLYQLVSPTTPSEIKVDVRARIELGEQISLAEINDRLISVRDEQKRQRRERRRRRKKSPESSEREAQAHHRALIERDRREKERHEKIGRLRGILNSLPQVTLAEIRGLAGELNAFDVQQALQEAKQ